MAEDLSGSLTAVEACLPAYRPNSEPVDALLASRPDLKETSQKGTYSCTVAEGLERCIVSVVPLSLEEKQALGLQNSQVAYSVSLVGTTRQYVQHVVLQFVKGSRPSYFIYDSRAKEAFISVLGLN